MICIAAMLLHWSPFASRREYEGLLRFMLPTHRNTETDAIAGSRNAVPPST